MAESFSVSSYGATAATAPLAPLKIQRMQPSTEQVLIEIHYCGVCHSDIHSARNEWGGTTYPIVPGHEIVGVVQKVGSAVKGFKAGDKVGVGCFVDSCRECASCNEGLEQYCEKGMVGTYNGTDRQGLPTYGGYSTHITVDQKYILRIPDNLPLQGAAPLLCAGITTYSPLRHWKVSQGQKVGVVGLGGLGHMGVKLAAAMGAEVVVFSTSDSKREDAKRLGAKHFVNTKDEKNLAPWMGKLDFLLNTVSANIDFNMYLGLLRRDATMVCVGAPEKPTPVHSFPLIMKRRSLAGSLIGGIAETQEMLNFCGQRNITSDIEVIPASKINEAYERMMKGDVKYRFVIDVKGSIA